MIEEEETLDYQDKPETIKEVTEDMDTMGKNDKFIEDKSREDIAEESERSMEQEDQDQS